MVDISILLGRILERVVKQEYAWEFTFSGGLMFRVDCLWRMLESGRIARTSEDHGHQFGLPEPVDCICELRQLLDKTVTAASVRAGTVDVSLGFGDQVLEIIATSAGYEAWVLSGQNVIVVGQPGYE